MQSKSTSRAFAPRPLVLAWRYAPSAVSATCWKKAKLEEPAFQFRFGRQRYASQHQVQSVEMVDCTTAGGQSDWRRPDLLAGLVAGARRIRPEHHRRRLGADLADQTRARQDFAGTHQAS